MGNCLKGVTSDNASLLREDTTLDHVEPPPPYQVYLCWLLSFVFERASFVMRNETVGKYYIITFMFSSLYFA